jgi:hypothetical protein
MALAAPFTSISIHLLSYIVAQQDIYIYWCYPRRPFSQRGDL